LVQRIPVHEARQIAQCRQVAPDVGVVDLAPHQLVALEVADAVAASKAVLAGVLRPQPVIVAGEEVLAHDVGRLALVDGLRAVGNGPDEKLTHEWAEFLVVQAGPEQR